MLDGLDIDYCMHYDEGFPAYQRRALLVLGVLANYGNLTELLYKESNPLLIIFRTQSLQYLLIRQ
jgi:hypothetical protein